MLFDSALILNSVDHKNIQLIVNWNSFVDYFFNFLERF